MKLQAWQKEKGLTQTALADFLGISNNHLNQYYHRSKNFSLKLALRIAEKTKIPILDILYPDGLKPFKQIVNDLKPKIK